VWFLVFSNVAFSEGNCAIQENLLRRDNVTWSERGDGLILQVVVLESIARGGGNPFMYGRVVPVVFS
jgi:hypothetical protein